MAAAILEAPAAAEAAGAGAQQQASSRPTLIIATLVLLVMAAPAFLALLIGIAVYQQHQDECAANGIPGALGRGSTAGAGTTTTGAGGQLHTTLGSAQLANARTIVQAAADLGLPQRAAQIGVATALVETTLRNPAGGDRDSVGLFQQRQAGWADAVTRHDPRKAAIMFFTGGLDGAPGLISIKNWLQLGLAQAAQAVQVSAFGARYGAWEQQASELVAQFWAGAVAASGQSGVSPEQVRATLGNTAGGVPAGRGSAGPGCDSAPVSATTRGLAQVRCTSGSGSITVDASIGDAVGRLLAAARADGILLCGGGYRDSSAQIGLRRAHCGTSHYAIYEMPSEQCSPPTAIPGQSMHERGLAIDFTTTSAGFAWLLAHSEEFGLKNYPKERWHFSTTGG